MKKYFINHFNINVTDIKKSLIFYERHFGLKEIRRKEDVEGKYIIVWIGDNSNNITIELTWIKEKEGNYNLGDNEFHIGLVTSDFDASYQDHKKAEIICYENKKMGIYFVNDPDGYWIEIVPMKK